MEFDIIFDKDGNKLEKEEAKEFIEDLWDIGIPPSSEDLFKLWEKWGERLGIPKPK